MSTSGLRKTLDQILTDLDVPASKYRDAEQRYSAVGDWLARDGSSLAAFDPHIYAQGSFALGTAVKPKMGREYDVDTVCCLRRPPRSLTQQLLKEIVGDRLRQSETYRPMIDPPAGGRRCWTLRYADESEFHLDILPAVPDDPAPLMLLGLAPALAAGAVLITDTETWGHAAGWPRSNPKGYAGWFKSRMKIALKKSLDDRRMITKAMLEEMPDYEAQTPLQRIVQLLKRHRDINYGDDVDRPISIIITTLAAKAYDNELDLADAVLEVIPRLRSGIERRGGVLWVPNPVSPTENFADKWAESPRKAELFEAWLQSVENWCARLRGANGEEELALLAKSMRESVSKTASTSIHLSKRSGDRFDVPHRQKPTWPSRLSANVLVSGTGRRDGFRPVGLKNGVGLSRHWKLRFEMQTDAAEPYDVYWQVVNTGDDALAVGGLRGSIFAGGSTRDESTLYRGTHWIECFVVKNGFLVARSGELVLRVD